MMVLFFVLPLVFAVSTQKDSVFLLGQSSSQDNSISWVVLEHVAFFCKGLWIPPPIREKSKSVFLGQVMMMMMIVALIAFKSLACAWWVILHHHYPFWFCRLLRQCRRIISWTRWIAPSLLQPITIQWCDLWAIVSDSTRSWEPSIMSVYPVEPKKCWWLLELCPVSCSLTRWMSGRGTSSRCVLPPGFGESERVRRRSRGG